MQLNCWTMSAGCCSFDDPGAIAAKTVDLLNNGTARHAMRKRAYLYARDMVWSRVAQKYMKSFERIYNERLQKAARHISAQNTEKNLDRLPVLKLDHLYRMTDHTGIVEHAVFGVPNYPEGYSTDYDNARALIVTTLLEELGVHAPANSVDLASRYLAFLWHAFDPTTKRFRNSLSYQCSWHEAEGSEDSHGRALWGLGTVLGRSKNAGLRGAAGRMFELAVPAAVEFKSPRACAFALLGLQEYLDSFPGDRAALSASDALANRLLVSYRSHRSDDWKWFENGLAYSNARLPQALIRAGMRATNEEMVWRAWRRWTGWSRCSGVTQKAISYPSARRAFTRREAKRPVSTSNLWKRAQSFRPPCKPIVPRGGDAGAKKRGPRSIGSWETTIFRSLYTIRQPADAETACILTVPMKIRGRNLRCLSC